MKPILVTCAILLAAVGSASGRDLNVALNADIRSIDPGVNRDSNTDGFISHIVEGLVGLSKNGEVKPLLAKSIEISPDGLTYTFPLRDNVKFHNGKPLTATDVVWAFERYLNPATKWTCLADFDGSKSVKIESVKALDPMTVTITLNKPSGIFLANVVRPECGYAGIYSPDSVAPDGTFSRPIGTGPFMWGEWRKGEYVTLRKFDGYVSPPNDGTPDGTVGSKRPLVDGIKFIIMPDASTVMVALEGGALDAAGIAPDAIPEIKANDKLRLVVVRNNGKHLFYIQTKDPILSNAGVRRAMAEALDMDELVANVSNGTGTPNASIITADSVYYSDVQTKRPPYDLELAKKELAKAGYKGEPITIICNKRGTVPSYPAAVTAQAMMQQVGLNIKLEVLDYATQADRRRSGNYQIISQSVSPRFDPVLSYNFYVGDKKENPSLMWDDPKAIELMNAAYAETDQKKRQALFDAFHELMLEEMPGIFLYDDSDLWGASTKLKGTPVWQATPRLWEVSIDD